MKVKDSYFENLMTTDEQDLEKQFRELLLQIQPVSKEYARICRNHWDGVAKPLDGLGRLEDLIVQIGSIRHTEQVAIPHRAVVVFCADNGVVAEGISQTGQEITAVIARLAADGKASVSAMAKAAGAEVFAVDMGVNSELHDVDHLYHRKVAPGTRNFRREKAMSRKEVWIALLTGARLAEELANEGYDILIAGEGGIGNTTTTAAVASVLLQQSASLTAGKGAGLSDVGLLHKIAVIEEAIAFHQPDPSDVIDVLSCVGGLDIAAMCGFYIGCAVANIPAIIDGVIASVAALCAVKFQPLVRGYLLPSHKSAEPAAELIMRELDFTPIMDGRFHLGEGTGAVALLPLLDLALAVYAQNTSFVEVGMDAYQPL